MDGQRSLAEKDSSSKSFCVTGSWTRHDPSDVFAVAEINRIEMYKIVELVKRLLNRI